MAKEIINCIRCGQTFTGRVPAHYCAKGRLDGIYGTNTPEVWLEIPHPCAGGGGGFITVGKVRLG